VPGAERVHRSKQHLHSITSAARASSFAESLNGHRFGRPASLSRRMLTLSDI
jgi:hypothetical protein